MSTPSPPSPFAIVVLGDSIMWGQGLRPGAPGAPSDKMAELVGVALATNPTVVTGWTGGAGLALSVSRFAHSGATINATLASPPGTRTTTVTTTTAFPAGELPGPTPTILDQLAGAITALGAATPPIAASAVNLVILDGGINDVGLFPFILNPLISPATVAARANAACGGALTIPGAAALAPPGAATGQMSAVLGPVTPTTLPTVATTFPNAIIVVTGYYDIISAFSTLTGLLIAVGVLSGSVSPEILMPGGWLVSVLAGTIAASAAASAVIANCAAFKTTADASLASAVALANAAPGGTFTAQGVTVPRFLFVLSPFAPINALFAGGSNGADETAATAPAFLWGFNPSLSTIGAVIDTSVTAGAAVGGVFGSLIGGIFGAGAGATLGAVAGAAGAIAAILPTLTAVDEVASSRTGPTGVCAGTPPGLFGTGVIPCDLASVGHPNIEGEAAYAGAIAPPLITLFGTTLPALGIAGIVGAISSGSQGCLIVTAALGSPHADEVDRLRWLRDEFTSRSRLGRDLSAAASKEYYAFSPIIAARMHSCAEFKDRVRCFAVLPYLSFIEVLSSWMASPPTDEFGELLTSTLDTSLKGLAGYGITPGRVAAAAHEVSRLSVHPAQGARTILDDPGIELRDVVDYFNAVAHRGVPSDGKYLNVLLIEPLKFYWRLLSERSTGASAVRIRHEFETGMLRWTARVSSLASLSTLSHELSADLELLGNLLRAKRTAPQSTTLPGAEGRAS